MDKFEQVVIECPLTVAIIANPQTGEFVLVEPKPVSAEEARSWQARGMFFVGVLGLKSVGQPPRAALAEQLPDAALVAICAEFIRLFERGIEQIEAANPGDSLTWLERLHRLEDKRD